MNKIYLLVEKVPEQKVNTFDPKTRKFVKEVRPIAEISQGEHLARLKQGETIETESRAFADFLKINYGLKEVKSPSSGQSKSKNGGK